jgi:Tfp pilus assembly protein PilO
MRLGTRVWALITTVLGIGILAAAWFLGASPFLQAQAQAETQRSAAVTQNEGIRSAIATLKEQKEKLPEYEARGKELEVAIPSDIESADLIRTLNNLATASGVTISQISFSDPLTYSPPTGEVVDAELAPNPVTDSRITGENFLLVPITLSVTGGWNEVLAFTHGMQTGDRLMLVTKVTTTANEGTFTTSLSGAMYVLIRPEAPAPTASGDESSDSDAATEG